MSALRYVVAVTLAVLLLGSTAAATPALPPGKSAVDLVASAQPTEGTPVETDQRTSVVRVVGPAARTDAVATASAGCRGCRGRAVTVQVVHVLWATSVRADNVATAWAGCRRCDAESVAVQVVLTGGTPSVRVNNRALAVTGGCRRCTADAVAYQVVIGGAAGPGDVHALARDLTDWAARQPFGTAATDGRPAARARADGVTTPPLADLENRVEEAVGGAVLRSAVARRSG